MDLHGELVRCEAWEDGGLRLVEIITKGRNARSLSHHTNLPFSVWRRRSRDGKQTLLRSYYIIL